MSQHHNLWGLDRGIDRCTQCGQTGCYGTCQERTRVTENEVDDEEIEPLDGDSFDDAWNRNIEEGDEDE